MPKKELERNKLKYHNVRRLVAIGFNAKRIIQVSGYKNVKRVKEICTDYDIDPPEDPRMSIHEAAWLLKSSVKTLYALIGADGICLFSTQYPIGPCGVTGDMFQDNIHKSVVMTLKNEWATLRYASNVVGISVSSLLRHIKSHERIDGRLGHTWCGNGAFKWNDHSGLNYLIRIDTARKLKQLKDKTSVEVEVSDQEVEKEESTFLLMYGTSMEEEPTTVKMGQQLALRVYLDDQIVLTCQICKDDEGSPMLILPGVLFT